MAVNPELEQQIAKDPNDPAPYLIYADWLLEHGDLRGELITVQHATLTTAGRIAALARQQSLFANHSVALLGELAEAIVPRPDRNFGRPPCHLEWFMGFIRSARLGWNDLFGTDLTVEQMLPQLLALPSARFLQQLSFGRPEPDGAANYQPLIQELCAAAAPDTLDSVFLGDFEHEEWDVKWSDIGGLSPLYARFPKLRRLRIHGVRIDLEALALPELRDLELETDVCDEGTLVSQILAGDARKLERLAVSFGPQSNSDLSLADFQPILDGAFPELRELSLAWLDFGGAFVDALVASKLAGTLRRLTLRSCHLHDRAASALADHPVPHLEMLDVELNYLTSAAVTRLAALCADVRVDNQWNADDDYLENED